MKSAAVKSTKALPNGGFGSGHMCICNLGLDFQPLFGLSAQTTVQTLNQNRPESCSFVAPTVFETEAERFSAVSG